MIFRHTPPKFLTLSDIVITYNDGKMYKIIPIHIAKYNMVIYDKYTDVLSPTNTVEKDITLSYCPKTSACVIYFGKYTVYKHDKYKNNIILQDSKDIGKLLIQFNGNFINTGTQTPAKYQPIRRLSTKIMTLRNAISMYKDPLYLHPHKTYEVSCTKLPYKIVYGIEYEIPNKNFAKKYSVIIGKSDGTNYIKSLYHTYFNKMYDKVIEKEGFIMPCYIDSWKLFYPETKVINLSKN